MNLRLIFLCEKVLCCNQKCETPNQMFLWIPIKDRVFPYGRICDSGQLYFYLSKLLFSSAFFSLDRFLFCQRLVRSTIRFWTFSFFLFVKKTKSEKYNTQAIVGPVPTNNLQPRCELFCGAWGHFKKMKLLIFELWFTKFQCA